MDILESVNSPGKGQGTGDDRFGHDEAEGTAWVIDGATDLGPARLFTQEESDAAWIAEALSQRLIRTPPGPMDVRAYFADVLTDLRAKAMKAARMDLAHAPKESLPIASGLWVRLRAGTAEFAWLGDCMGLIRPPGGRVEVIGTPDKADLETGRSRAFAQASREDKLAELRRIRAVQNTDPGALIFGTDPRAVANLQTAGRPAPAGTDIVLMSDGLWRLIAPYGETDADGLMALIDAGGVSGAVSALRAFEARPGRDTTSRFKAADDACAVWLRA